MTSTNQLVFRVRRSSAIEAQIKLLHRWRWHRAQ